MIFCGSIAINLYVQNSNPNATYNDLELTPYNKVGLLLGTSPKTRDGLNNLFFIYRIQAATELFKNDKVDFLLVSGDNANLEYNEPESIKNSLIAAGIPEQNIILDYAGFSTLDSVIRSKKVFGQNSITIISQEFQNKRAILIAQQNDIEAVGYNAQEVSAQISPRVYIREYFARIKLFLDLYIFKTQPKFLGEPIVIE